MTKRFLIIILAFVLIFSTVGCGSNKDTNIKDTNTTTSQTEENKIPDAETDAETDDVLDETLADNETEVPDDTTSNADETEDKDDKGNDKKKPNNKSETTVTTDNTTTKKPTTTQTTTPSNTTKDEDNKNNISQGTTNKVPNVKEIKLVERKITNPYILKDGTDLVARLYGNQTIQTGDKLIFDVVLENAELSDCVIKVFGGTFQIKGNQVEITANGERNTTFLHIELPGYNSNANLWGASDVYNVVQYDGNLIEMFELELKYYAQRKGIRYCNGTDVWGYIWNPVTKESDVNLSITKNISRGCDTIMIEGNKYWVDDCINLIDKYKEIGIVQLFIEKQQKFIAFEADTEVSMKYWENQ